MINEIIIEELNKLLIEGNEDTHYASSIKSIIWDVQDNILILSDHDEQFLLSHLISNVFTAEPNPLQMLIDKRYTFDVTSTFYEAQHYNLMTILWKLVSNQKTLLRTDSLPSFTSLMNDIGSHHYDSKTLEIIKQVVEANGQLFESKLEIYRETLEWFIKHGRDIVSRIEKRKRMSGE